MQRLCLTLILSVGGLALAQAVAPASPLIGSPRTASYYLAPVEGSGVTGYLQATEEVTGGTKLVVTLQGITPGASHALALFEGDCGPDRPLVSELEPVPNLEGDPYASLSFSNLPFAAFAEGDYFLYVYAGETTDTPIAACGEVGLDANASGFSTETTTDATTDPSTSAVQPATPSETTPAQTASASSNQEFASPRAASYGLFAVEGSGVSGNVQISEQVEGGVRITVSLVGITAGERYAVALYEGDCGPDRPQVLRLSNVDDSDGNPFSSITDSELSFEAITGGNHFAYVFAGEPGSALLACGEVGLGT